MNATTANAPPVSWVIAESKLGHRDFESSQRRTLPKRSCGSSASSAARVFWISDAALATHLPWIAKLVGRTGLVVGIDEWAEVIDVAQRRATVAGQCFWARFVTADLNTFVPHKRFDAVIARLTLFRQGERATFSRLSACVRPNGVIMVVLGKRAATPWRRPLSLESWLRSSSATPHEALRPTPHLSANRRKGRIPTGRVKTCPGPLGQRRFPNVD
jgi:hypothetical protein